MRTTTKIFDTLLVLFVLAGPVMAKTIATASWYGVGDGSGEYTASGMHFNPMNPYRVAHKTLPFGTRLMVTNVENGKALCVEVQDRGPFVPGRDFDLTLAGALMLGFVEDGIAKLTVQKEWCYIPRIG